MARLVFYMSLVYSFPLFGFTREQQGAYFIICQRNLMGIELRNIIKNFNTKFGDTSLTKHKTGLRPM